jgi:hypothetical protein
MRFLVGRRCLSNLPLILGGDASRTPAICGRDAQGLDCFLFLSARVFFVKVDALSSNIRFFRASD